MRAMGALSPIEQVLDVNGKNATVLKEGSQRRMMTIRPGDPRLRG